MVIFHIFFSVLGHRIPELPIPLFNVYPASKYALTAITQTIRQELAYQKASIKLTVRIISTNCNLFVCLISSYKSLLYQSNYCIWKTDWPTFKWNIVVSDRWFQSVFISLVFICFSLRSLEWYLISQNALKCVTFYWFQPKQIIYFWISFSTNLVNYGWK